MNIVQIACVCVLGFAGEVSGAWKPKKLPEPPRKEYNLDDFSEIEGLIDAVENPREQWRIDAYERIEKHRKGDLSIHVVDRYGKPVTGAILRVSLYNHAFNFGGVMKAKQLAMESPSPIPPDQYKELYAYFFNHAGFSNALKSKLRRGHEHLVQPILDWLEDINMPVRGHALIWPSIKNSSKEMVELLEAEDKEGVRQLFHREISEWAAKWKVSEWDVMNEVCTNQVHQKLLGDDVMVDFFNIAKEHVVPKGMRLLYNEYGIVSMTESHKKSGIRAGFEDKINQFEHIVRFLQDNDCPITALGFQSRFKDHIPPEVVYERLERLSKLGLPMVGTEHEVVKMVFGAGTAKERVAFDPSEELQAQITTEVLTQYFSHPQVYGLFAWTFISKTAEEPSGLFTADGRLLPVGRAWLYLTKYFWNTDVEVRTDSKGIATVRGFKGEYFVEAASGHKTAEGRTVITGKHRHVKIVVR